ncbi:MAG: hypothetical protein Q8O92_10930, partial [Candidatus Latescibacter sp.]|nr:hypothetical protein [Candidatus Latescibacter sp.]
RVNGSKYLNSQPDIFSLNIIKILYRRCSCGNVVNAMRFPIECQYVEKFPIVFKMLILTAFPQLLATSFNTLLVSPIFSYYF